MRGCLGVFAGLVIGAAVSFAALAVVAAVGEPEETCLTAEPSGWLIRVQVPWVDIGEELGSASVPAVGGRLTIQELAPGSCGRLQVRGSWEGFGVRLSGLGLILEPDDGASMIVPVRLLLGKVSVPLGWMPETWPERAAGPVMQVGGAVLSRQLQGEGMKLCGLVGEEEGLALYFCSEDD